MLVARSVFLTYEGYTKGLSVFVYALLTQQDSIKPLFSTCVRLLCCLATKHCFHNLIEGFLCVLHWLLCALHAPVESRKTRGFPRFSLDQWEIDPITSGCGWFWWITVYTVVIPVETIKRLKMSSSVLGARPGGREFLRGLNRLEQHLGVVMWRNSPWVLEL